MKDQERESLGSELVGQPDGAPDPLLSPRFADALVYMAQLHAQQARKATRIPYIGHLLSVAGLVLEDGGGEDEAIAALLHDAVEDQGGEETLAEIKRRFGHQVASIVAACSDTTVTPKPPWRARKVAYLKHLLDAPPAARRVSLADKLHNARAILADYRAVDESLWQRFNVPRDETLWYYRELVNAFREAGTASPMLYELQRVVAEIEQLAAARQGHVTGGTASWSRRAGEAPLSSGSTPNSSESH